MKLLLRSTLLALVLYFGIPFWANAEEPIRTYPETTWCGGVQLVRQYADGHYAVERLGECPTLWIDGSPEFQATIYQALEWLHRSQPEVTSFLLTQAWHIVEANFTGVAPNKARGEILVNRRLCEGVGGWQWCATTIAAHEALHLAQFSQGRSWCGRDAEREANDYQADVLERLTAGATGGQWPRLVDWLRASNHGDWSGYPSCT